MSNGDYRDLMRAAIDVPLEAQVDPRLLYGLVAPTDAGRRFSIFQEFSEAAILQRFAYEKIVELPATFFEPLMPWPQLLSSRAIGLVGWRIRRLSASWLDHLAVPSSLPIWTLFSQDEESEAAIERLRARARFPPLHVSLRQAEGIAGLPELDLERLARHVIEVAEASGHPGLLAMRPVVMHWKARETREAPMKLMGHHAFLPNQMVLRSLGYDFADSVPDWTSENVADFETELEQAAELIGSIREEAEVGPAIRFLPPYPDLWLVAPSLTPNVKSRFDLAPYPPEEQRAATEFMRRLERQQAYNRLPSDAEIERYQNSELAQELAQTRNNETGLFAAAIGVRVAGTLAATLRMPPSINQIAGRVSALADNIRAEARTPPEKVARMFGEIQDRIAASVGPKFIQRVADARYGIKVVSDAPIEWLPIDGLPLCLETDVSRIPATPGEMAVIQLMEHEPLRLSVDDFAEVLVVSAFEKSDRLAHLMRRALDTVAPAWGERLRVRFETVADERQLVAAMNSYDGPLMIFDGHGGHPRDKPGHLKVGSEEVNVWTLRGRVRTPPIVVLSACDTHAAGRTPLTTANAFLLLGARTVLATTLPIGGASGAMFIARLVLRIADYLPRAARAYGRVVRWSEIAGGMLRMQFLTDLLHPHGRPGEWLTIEQWLALGPEAGYRIGRGGRGWMRWLGLELEKLGVADEERLRRRVRGAVPMSDTIRYAQLGNPETILIGDLADLSEEAKAEFAGDEKALKPIWRDPPRPEGLEPPRLIS